MPPRVLPLLFCLLLLTGCLAPASGAPPATATPSAPPAAEARLLPPRPFAYAALGASETYGVGAAPHTRGYAYLVARALHARPFVDVGIPGTTLNAGYQTELAGALDIRPRLCTVFFGFNDLRGGVQRAPFLRDLTDLVVTLRRARCRVLVIGMPDLSLLPAVRRTGIGGIGLILRRWNAGMRSVAVRHGAAFLDLAAYSAELAAHPGYISADGLHPSNAGHARLAAVVLSAIRARHLWSR